MSRQESLPKVWTRESWSTSTRLLRSLSSPRRSSSKNTLTQSASRWWASSTKSPRTSLTTLQGNLQTLGRAQLFKDPNLCLKGFLTPRQSLSLKGERRKLFKARSQFQPRLSSRYLNLRILPALRNFSTQILWEAQRRSLQLSRAPTILWSLSSLTAPSERRRTLTRKPDRFNPLLMLSFKLRRILSFLSKRPL